MDLNKDNQDIYAIDRESYSSYMKERESSSSFLTSIINILLIVLLVMLAYFFYNVVKKDLTFSDVFNQKRFLASYGSLYAIKKTKEDRPVAVLSAFKIREEVEVVSEVKR